MHNCVASHHAPPQALAAAEQRLAPGAEHSCMRIDPDVCPLWPSKAKRALCLSVCHLPPFLYHAHMHTNACTLTHISYTRACLWIRERRCWCVTAVFCCQWRRGWSKDEERRRQEPYARLAELFLQVPVPPHPHQIDNTAGASFGSPVQCNKQLMVRGQL